MHERISEFIWWGLVSCGRPCMDLYPVYICIAKLIRAMNPTQNIRGLPKTINAITQ